MKTLYSTHNCADGTSLPICAMSNIHLINHIRVVGERFCAERDAYSSRPANDDPMLEAMGSMIRWNNETLVTKTSSTLTFLHPYLSKAIVRGGAVLAMAESVMHKITKRAEAAELPRKIVLGQNADDISWDSATQIGMDVPE